MARKSAKSKVPSIGQRRKAIVGIAACIGSLAFAAYKMNTPAKITFEEAQKNPELRESYVKQHQEMFERPYIASVEYAPQPKDNQHSGAGSNVPLSDFGKKIPIKFQIFPTAFEGKISSEGEFLNTIIDHEIEGHGKYIYYGDLEIPHTAFKVKNTEEYHSSVIDAVELIAYGEQLAQGKSRNVRDLFKNHNFGQYSMHYQRLLQTPRNLPIEDPTIIDRVLVKGFQELFLHGMKNGQPLITYKNNTFFWRVDEKTEIPMPEGIRTRVTLLK